MGALSIFSHLCRYSCTASWKSRGLAECAILGFQQVYFASVLLTMHVGRTVRVSGLSNHQTKQGKHAPWNNNLAYPAYRNMLQRAYPTKRETKAHVTRCTFTLMQLCPRHCSQIDLNSNVDIACRSSSSHTNMTCTEYTTLHYCVCYVFLPCLLCLIRLLSALKSLQIYWAHFMFVCCLGKLSSPDYTEKVCSFFL